MNPFMNEDVSWIRFQDRVREAENRRLMDREIKAAAQTELHPAARLAVRSWQAIVRYAARPATS